MRAQRLISELEKIQGTPSEQTEKVPWVAIRKLEVVVGQDMAL